MPFASLLNRASRPSLPLMLSALCFVVPRALAVPPQSVFIISDEELRKKPAEIAEAFQNGDYSAASKARRDLNMLLQVQRQRHTPSVEEMRVLIPGLGACVRRFTTLTHDDVGKVCEEALFSFGAEAIPEYVRLIQVESEGKLSGRANAHVISMAAGRLVNLIAVGAASRESIVSQLSPALPTLIGLMRRGWDRMLLYAPLKLITFSGKDAIPELLANLRHEDAACRELAARTLGGIGGAAAATLSELRALEQDPEPRVRAAAQEAVAKIEAAPDAN